MVMQYYFFIRIIIERIFKIHFQDCARIVLKELYVA